MNIPTGHQAVMPYLSLNGAKKFIDFTVAVFNGKPTFTRMRDNDTVMHAEVQINGSTIMVCDGTEQWKTATGNLFIYVEDADATYREAVAAGAETILELRNESYGRTCGITDPFGNVWWIITVQQ